MTDQLESLKALAKIALERGVKLFNKLGPDEICPTYFVQDEDGNIFEAKTPFRNDMEKRLYKMAVKESCKQFGAVRYALLTEGWSVERKVNDPEELRAPKECPDRKEILLVLAEDDETSMMLSYEIIRHENSAPYLNLENLQEEINTVENAGGNLQGIIPAKKPKVLQ